jgi:predicted nuclease of predicted toxin-antitoxin system
VKLLLDSCLSGATADALRHLSFDVVWSGEWANDPGDPAILSRAHLERRILITLDKDYGELAVRYRQPHFGIVRLVDLPVEEHAGRCDATVQRYAAELEGGAIVTVEFDRTRVRLGSEDDDALPDA